MIVMKFGGTSVEDAAAMHRVIAIARREEKRTPVIVLSACAGVTNELLRAARTVHEGDRDKALYLLDKLRNRHRSIGEELLHGKPLDRLIESIDTMFQELRNYVRGVHLLGELTNRSLDAFSGFGERLSSTIVAAGMQEQGLPAVYVDASTVLLTDDSFTMAQPDMAATAERAKKIFLPLIEAGKIIVTQGFIGSTATGTVTTIGRGGSDYSAAIFGSVLNADEIQIWTDVDGMMTADPRIVETPRRIDVMGFDEAAELAYFGAKVLHPNTILPAVRKNIPVRVLNSRRPELSGTLIVRETARITEQPVAANAVVKSIACKRGITVINVNSSRMLMAHGFLAKLFAIFADHQKSIDVVSTSEVSVSVTVDSEEGLEDIRRDLETIGEVRIERDKAIVCIVGEGMKSTPGIGGRILDTLGKADVNIEMVSEGASEINLTLVVDGDRVADAVNVLHKEFFG